MATKVYRCSLCCGIGHNKRTCFLSDKIDALGYLVVSECERQLVDLAISASMPTTPNFKSSADEFNVDPTAPASAPDMLFPMPSAPQLPVPVVIQEDQPAYAPMALLEEALAHAQTRAREAEEKVDTLTTERDNALRLVTMLQLELAEVKKERDVAKETAAGLKVDNKDLSILREKLKSELDSVLSSNTAALQTISALLDENEKLSKNKLTDAEEFALLLDQYDVHNQYWTCEYNIAARRGNDGDSFRSMELKRWLEFLKNLKSNNPIILDKNDVSIWVGQLLNGYKEPGCLHNFRPPAHGTVPHINYNLAKWLKQKGYLPSDFTGNLDKCCDEERCEFHNIKRYHGTPHPTL